MFSGLGWPWAGLGLPGRAVWASSVGHVNLGLSEDGGIAMAARCVVLANSSFVLFLFNLWTAN